MKVLIDLKAERKRANMTQFELAEKVGVTREHICQIELGKSKVSPNVAQKIAKELNFDWTRFFEEQPQ